MSPGSSLDLGPIVDGPAIPRISLPVADGRQPSATRGGLTEAPNYWQVVLDSLDDGLIVIDRRRQVLWANRVIRERWGDAAALVGQPCHQVADPYGPCTSPDCECPFNLVVESGQPVRAVHRHANPGQPAWVVEIIASPVRDDEGEICQIVELLRDVSEEYALRETLVRRNLGLAALNAVNEASARSHDLQKTIQTALDEVLALTGMEAGVIFLVHPDSDQLELSVQRNLPPETVQALVSQPPDDGPCGEVIKSGQPLILSDIECYRGTYWERLHRDRLRAWAHVPLISSNQIIGSLCVGGRAVHHFAEEEISTLVAIAGQVAMAVENTRLYAELERKERMRGELLQQVITAQEEERKRIARELHDDTSQSLTTLLYAFETVAELGNPGGEITHLLMRMHSLAQQTLEGVYDLIGDLRPAALDQLGLYTALQAYAEQRLGETGIILEMNEHGNNRRLSPTVETALFRIVQEAISNVAEHACATRVAISFDYYDDRVSVTVDDDGIGFDPAEVDRSTDFKRGLGLLGMKERAEPLAGQVRIFSLPSEGTRVLVTMPLGEEVTDDGDSRLNG